MTLDTTNAFDYYYFGILLSMFIDERRQNQ